MAQPGAALGSAKRSAIVLLVGAAALLIALLAYRAHRQGPSPGDLDAARDIVAASATVPVLVDFHAEWCPPCAELRPELVALAAARGGRLRLVQVDIDAHPDVAFAHGVEGIPDVRLWSKGPASR